jgi:hypothetical protein
MHVLTLTDIAKRLDPSGKISMIVEMLAQTNEILQDMPFIEGNLETGHRTTVRTGLPTVAWRLLNQGIVPSNSRTAQITEATGILEAWSETDKDVADLGGNPAAVRLSEAEPFIEAMGQEMASTVFYGDSSTAPEEFTGLSPRYSSLSAENSRNIVNAGGVDAADNASIWLICWGPNKVCGIYPRGSKVGLDHKDFGEQVIESTAGVGGARLLAYRDRWQWKAGVAVKDWQYAVRICNIDISALVAKVAAADLFDFMIKAIHRIRVVQNGQCYFYMNRTVHQMLDIQTRDDVQVGGGLTFQNSDGAWRSAFRGIPIRICDALLDTEARVV